MAAKNKAVLLWDYETVAHLEQILKTLCFSLNYTCVILDLKERKKEKRKP